MTRLIRRSLLTGLAFFLPLALLAVVAYGLGLVLLRVLSTFDAVLAALGVEGPAATVLAVGSLALGVPAALVATGLVVQNRYGALAGKAVDAVLERIPVIGPIYNSLERSRRVLTDEGFSDVVSLALADGVDVLAFVVGQDSGADWTDGSERVTVFVPLAPNPTVGGHLLAVRPERITETGLSLRAALTVLVTVGASDAGDAEPPVAGLYRGLTEEELTGVPVLPVS
ncbi:hypothetical protein BRC62_00660 [Halobacteriales archaeon QH_10_67_13]|nr:MAG: hypothetical protein BRC62_00660 [Halobacteriales archaeon QH_10_67_13]